MASSTKKRTTSNKKTTRSRAGASGRGTSKTSRGRATSKKLTKAQQEALLQEEKRAMEVRRDIHLVILLAVMVFVMIAEFGAGGIAGKFVSDVMFGLFGAIAYIAPFCVFFGAIFYISNRGKRTLPAKMTAGVLLLLMIGVLFDLGSGGADASSAYNLTEIFRRCAEGKNGGGIFAGSLAFLLFKIFRQVGTYLIVGVIMIICGLVMTQHSLIAAYRRSRDARIDRGELSFMEKRRERALIAKEIAMEERAEKRERRELLQREEKEQYRERMENRRKLKEQREEERRLRAEEAKKRAAEKRAAEKKAAERKAASKKAAAAVKASTDPADMSMIELTNESPVEAPAPDFSKEDKNNGLFGIGGRAKKISQDLIGGQVNPEDVDFESMNVDLTPALAEMAASRVKGGEVSRMTVFSESSVSDDGGFRFPFEHHSDKETVKSMYKPGHASESASVVSDIADAGGVSSFDAVSDVHELKTSGNEVEKADDIPWIEDEPWGDPPADENMLYPEDIDELYAAEEAEERQEKMAAMNESVHVTAAPAKATISEEEMAGIEVHRERGETQKLGEKARVKSSKSYVYPPFSLMPRGSKADKEETDRELKETALNLQNTLRTFGVNVTITAISQGPSVTRYEMQPEQGVKVSKIVSLADDIKLALAAVDIRIEAPIPGKSAIGIEVPNKVTQMVALRDILESPAFKNAKSKLAFGVGKDLGGQTIVTDIAKMPHLLIAGTTGSGKSVCINTIIMSILYHAAPDEVKLLMIDPKVVELSIYNGIPHLMIPVVTDVRKASAALNWAVAEMEKRYKLFAAAGVRDLNGYNEKLKEAVLMGESSEEPMPRIVVIVDELADLMMVAKNEVETAICRLAQLARAAGIHLIIATQRPSVDVITGLIKANMPSRIAFAVNSQVDSRTILDMAGAEKLIGKGDMLFYPQSYQKPVRVQGAFMDDRDVQRVTDFIKEHNQVTTSSTEIDDAIENIASGDSSGGGFDSGDDSGRDEYFIEAGKFIIEKNKASIGLLQRRFKIGFNRAARIMDQLAEAGVVSEENGTKARTILMNMMQFDSYITNEM